MGQKVRIKKNGNLRGIAVRRKKNGNGTGRRKR